MVGDTLIMGITDLGTADTTDIMDITADIMADITIDTTMITIITATDRT
jgi:hypothetical protein